jgi:hypothetical protein
MAITSKGLERLGFDRYNDYVLQDDGSGVYIAEWKSAQPQPSDADIETAHAEWRVERNSTEYQRLREYPPIGDQLDALFHAGVFPADMAAQLQAVKDKYPR